MRNFEISRGVNLPEIGIGTWLIKDPAVIYDIIDAGLAAGYRLIDTAACYQNEKFIAEALETLLPKYGLKRDDIFITSKLWHKGHGHQTATAGALKSLEDLKTDYIDLYLIHWPGLYGIPVENPRNRKLRKQSWLELEELKKAGKFRAIGVSNYMVHHLEDLKSYASVMPAVNQCEYHPHYVISDVVNYCREHGIHFQAYSSLGSLSKEELFNEPLVQELTTRYQCTKAQLLLAWSLCQDVSVLPKTQKRSRLGENFKAIEVKISPEDIARLAALGAQKKTKYCWDPEKVA